MATPAPATTPPESSPWYRLEQILKLLPAFAVAVYVAGFLVVGAHDGRYGIRTFDLFRSRIIAAGCAFVFFTAIPVVSCITLWLNYRNTTLQMMKAFLFPPAAWCVILIFNWRDYRYRVFCIWVLGITLVCTLCTIVAHFGPHIGLDLDRMRSVSWLISLLAVTVFGTCATVFGAHTFGELGVLGGRPLPVLLHVSHPTAFCKDDCHAFLIDETDRGYYVIHQQNDKKASFIPREAIASIDFQSE